jgi:hypothetical protein
MKIATLGLGQLASTPWSPSARPPKADMAVRPKADMSLALFSFRRTNSCRKGRAMSELAAWKRGGSMRSLKVRRDPLALLVSFGVLAPAIGAANAAEDLPRLGVTLSAKSVSGLSSGAYMAGQIEVAHSKDIVGAGIVAGGPFACAETESSSLFPYWPVVVWQNAMQAANACMEDSWGAPDADKLAKRAKELADDGQIDELSGLADDKVYLFSGNEDQTVVRAVVESDKRFYAAAGVPEANVTLVEREGGHAFLTETEGTACGLSKEPYVSDCGYGPGKGDPRMDLWLPPCRPLAEPDREVHHFRPIRFQQGRLQRACRGGRRLRADPVREPSRLPPAYRAPWL